jgi:hypothetical protein
MNTVLQCLRLNIKNYTILFKKNKKFNMEDINQGAVQTQKGMQQMDQAAQNLK